MLQLTLYLIPKDAELICEEKKMWKKKTFSYYLDLVLVKLDVFYLALQIGKQFRHRINVLRRNNSLVEIVETKNHQIYIYRLC